LNHSIV